MLLVIDLGNTNINIGLFSLASNATGKLITSFRVSTRVNMTADELGIFIISTLRHNKLDHNDVYYIVCSSVVPYLNRCIEVMASDYFNNRFIFVSNKLNTGLIYRYSSPSDIGADRITNAVAVDKLYGGPAIIVDFGTATTFCALSKNREYLGGVIAPGITTSLDTLVSKGSKLPNINLTKPASVLAKDTSHSIKSGIYFGTIYMLEGIISGIRRELKGAKVVATGGELSIIVDSTSIIDIVDYNLTLKGLELLYYSNYS